MACSVINTKFVMNWKYAAKLFKDPVQLWCGVQSASTERQIWLELTRNKSRITVLGNGSIPSEDELVGEYQVPQQSKAAVHDSNVTKQFFKANDIEVLEWFADFLNLKIIENLWGQLVCHEYANSRQLKIC